MGLNNVKCNAFNFSINVGVEFLNALDKAWKSASNLLFKLSCNMNRWLLGWTLFEEWSALYHFWNLEKLFVHEINMTNFLFDGLSFCGFISRRVHVFLFIVIILLIIIIIIME